MAVLPEAIITHSTPRRTRLRLPAKRGDSLYFSGLLPHLANLEGVEQVVTNSRLGSILIQHRADPGSIWRLAEERNLFFVETNNQEVERPLEGTILVKMRQKFAQLDQQTISRSEGRLDMATLGFLSLLGVAGYDLLRGNLSRPAWYAALWYASAIFFSPAAKPPTTPAPEETENISFS